MGWADPSTDPKFVLYATFQLWPLGTDLLPATFNSIKLNESHFGASLVKW